MQRQQGRRTAPISICAMIALKESVFTMDLVKALTENTHVQDVCPMGAETGENVERPEDVIVMEDANGLKKMNKTGKLRFTPMTRKSTKIPKITMIPKTKMILKINMIPKITKMEEYGYGYGTPKKEDGYDNANECGEPEIVLRARDVDEDDHTMLLTRRAAVVTTAVNELHFLVTKSDVRLTPGAFPYQHLVSEWELGWSSYAGVARTAWTLSDGIH